MPVSGNTHSLPAGVLVSNGQTADASQHNPGFTDLSAGVTEALNRISGMVPQTQFTVSATDNNVYGGSNVNPSRWVDLAAPLVKGQYNVAIGTQVLLPTNAKTHVSVFVGPWVASNAGATGLYGVELMGFRAGENMADGQYVTGLGIDAFKTATYARNSAALGAKAGLYKTDVQGVTLLGPSTAYAPGVISNSLIAGVQAADGFASDTNVYSFANCTIVGPLAGRGNKANGNTFLGANAASSADITGVQNVAVGRSSLFTLAAGSYNTAIGDACATSLVNSNFVTVIGAAAVTSVVPGSGGIYIGSQVEPSSSGIVDEINIGAVIYGLRTAGSQHIRVNGHFRKATAALPLVNGLNSNVTCPNADVLRISGAITAPFSLGGLTGGFAGRTVDIYSPFGFDFTIVADDPSSIAANRIRCRGATSRTITGGAQWVTIKHTGTEWVLASTNQSP
jgi:hypothetical protein